MKAIVLFATLYGNLEKIAAAYLAKEMGLHYNEI
jgi:menaquinone-dependent protoporphyrinogen IX oxidase